MTRATGGLPVLLRRVLLWLGYKFGVSRQFVLPVSLDLEPVNTCNFRCPHCQVTHLNRPKSVLSEDGFHEIVRQLPGLREIKLQGMGEPLLHKRLPSLLKAGEGLGKHMTFFSNGSIMSQTIIDELTELSATGVTFSVDGAHEHTFETVRVGGDFSLVCRNIRSLVTARDQRRSPLTIGMWTVVTQQNLAELADIVLLAKELGVDKVTFQLFLSNWGKTDMKQQIGSERLQIHDRETLESLSRAESLAKSLSLVVEVYRGDLLTQKKRCSWPWRSAFIAANGDVVPCCLIANSEIVKMGNVFEQDFQEIWNSPQYRNLRKRIRDHDVPHYCRNCYEA